MIKMTVNGATTPNEKCNILKVTPIPEKFYLKFM